MLDAITDLLFQIHPLVVYGIVAVVLALESTGVPLMNNTLLLLTGAMASMGRLNIWELGVAALVGSVVGACAAYSIGKFGGRRLLLQVTGWLHVKPERVEIVENWFQKSGGWMVFLSRVIPYVRPIGCFPAGIARMRWSIFLLSAATGSLIWCSGLLAAGWFLGNRWELALQILQRYSLIVVFVILLLIVLYIVLMVWLKKYLRTRFRATPNGINDERLSN